MRIVSVREHQGRLLVRLAGVEDADAAAAFVGARFYARRDQIELAPGEYLDRELIGCTLVDEHGAVLGTVERVEHYPASDMLVVGGQLVPMIHQFIRDIDVAARRVHVGNLPEGLLDPARAEEG